MKNSLFYLTAALALPFVMLSCRKEEQPPLPELSATKTSVEIGYEGETVEFTVYANRSFSISCDESWLAFDPSVMEMEAGEIKEHTIKVTALKNAGEQRSAEFTVKIPTSYIKFTVIQEGAPDAIPSIVYSNDFDAEVAVETDNIWPGLNTFNGWRNESGSGAGTVEYYGTATSIRSNSNSNASYSDYEGSGSNNLFFGASSYFVIGKVSLHKEHRGLSLSFGSERYLYGAADNTFNPDEFPVMISKDGSNWVSLTYSFPGNTWPNGRWNLATASFTLPEETAELWIRFAPTLGSAYRLDDVSLKASDGGAEVDWSKAVQIKVENPITPVE